MTRRVFYSFHYAQDNSRAAQVRKIGAIEGNPPATDNRWEEITQDRKPELAIKSWIRDQMRGRTCTVVLVGAETAKRKWIDYEIVESWKSGMGVVGIRIHGLKDFSGETSPKGANPFDYLPLGSKKLSSAVRCYDPQGSSSQEKYAWITKHLAAAVEEAIEIRNSY